ncbi:MAG: cupin domain-containing protein [Acidimicrobiales bacterium]
MRAEDFAAEMAAAGHPVTVWANAPGDTYAAHSHGYQKVLCCLEGSIVFHLAGHDEPLSQGERLVLEPGTEHSATVGPSGVRCAEAHVR